MQKPIDLASLRKEYSLKDLTIEETASNPFVQFRQWFDEALQTKVHEPNAMHLATVSPDGRPSGRIVLLKDLSEETGFTFFTNYESRKGKELFQCPWASLTFFWPELERQVRIEGRVQKVSPEQSDTYFNSRPRGSQIGAWASSQSEAIESRNVLEKATQQVEEKFAPDQPVPRPAHWGGYALFPDQVEFWQGRPSRLHDRIVYELKANQWKKGRLSP